MTTRILFGPFRVTNMNLSSTDFVDGIPSPSAALGFVGSIMRKLGETGWDHKAIFVIHELTESGGRVRGEQKAAAGKVVPVEIQEQTLGHGLITVIAEIPGFHDLEDIVDAFMLARFSGGAISAPSGASLRHLVRVVDDANTKRVLRVLPRGYALCPPQARPGTEIVSFGEMMSLEAIAMRAYSAEGRQKGGIIVPVPAGYRVLEDTYCETPSGYVRDEDVPFALVDTAVGLGEFVSIRNRDIFETVDVALNTCAWSWACAGNLKMLSQFHLDAARQ